MRLSLSKEHCILFVILLVTVIYLFPFFIGKVDTPTDIRDVLMYPWRHHAVDKNIKKTVLWKTTSSRFNLEVPQGIRDFTFDFNVQRGERLSKLANANYYITFDFKSDDLLKLSLGLVNKQNNTIVSPRYAVSPLSNDWSRAYYDLNSVLPSSLDLNSFNILIRAENKGAQQRSLSVSNLKLAYEDFSNIPTVHNYYINDLIQMFTPFREFYSNSIKKLQFPFWNNYIFSGAEFLAEPQLPYFHPIYCLTYFMFDHFTAHGIITFLCLFFSGVGAFFLARFWKLSISASLFTSIVYMFHPFNATWFSYEHMLMNSATLPFLLLFYEKNLLARNTFNRYLVLSALLLGLIFLSGHLQYIYYTFIFFILYAVFKFFISQDKNITRHLSSIIVISTGGVLIGLVVIIPFFPVFLNSHRIPNSTEFIQANSFSLKSFLGLIYPFYGGNLQTAHFDTSKVDPKYLGNFFNHYIYFGFLPFLFLLYSLKKIISNKLIMFFFIVILISFLICTGSPVYFLVKNVLPGFKEMQHFRFLQLYSYSVPFLAGFGFEYFLSLTKGLKEKLKLILVSLIIVITVVDLMYYSSFFVTWTNRNAYKPLPEKGSVSFLLDKRAKSQQPFRVLPFSVGQVGGTKLKVNIAQPNTLLPYELEDVSGYSSFINKDIYNLFVYIQTKDLNKLYTKESINLFSNPNIPFPIYNFKSKILDLLNVKYFLVPNVITIDPKYATKVFDGDSAIYENKDYLSRAFFVPSYIVIKDSKATIVKLDSNDFNPKKEMILTVKPDAVLNTSEESNNANVKVVYDQNKITLKANVTMSGFLVLGHNLNNNWIVKVNGKQSKHYKANLVQRAVYLPKEGSYLVEFLYSPKLFLIGGLLSLFTMFLLVLLLIFFKREIKST